MISRTQILKSKVHLPGEDDYNLQLEDLKDTFKNFYLIKYKKTKIGEVIYNSFTFYHDFNISINKSRY